RSMMVAGKTAPMLLRFENALVSYVLYIWKMIWPVDLAVFYPFPTGFPVWQILGAAIVLLAITFMVTISARKHAYLFVGWAWYVCTLFPAIGLVQVGLWPAMADRFVYIPLIGLFIMIVWGFHRLFGKFSFYRTMAPAALACIAFILMSLTSLQVGFWKNSESLFAHALKVTKGNHLAYNNLGSFYASKGELDKALSSLEEAVRIMPDNPMFLNNMGTVLARMGRYPRATKYLSRALELVPTYAEAYVNMGFVLSRQGKVEDANSLFRRALEIKPLSEAHHNLGLNLARQRDLGQAIFHYKKALELRPNDPRIHNDLGVALAQQGRIREAISHFSEAIRLDPEYVMARHNLRAMQERTGNPAEAIKKQ
ncbi:MAG: tetratricopeptide repeat protein, partial [Deltaproteobacteria bacterium]|nr:tetratricopeptide repeat protein [Deltaproteobacteria bacterium]